MTQKAETLGARRTRVPRCVCLAADTSDHTAPLTAVQAARLLRKFKASEAVAQTLAELVFANGRAP
jgi:hypothetical protein